MTATTATPGTTARTTPATTTTAPAAPAATKEERAAAIAAAATAAAAALRDAVAAVDVSKDTDNSATAALYGAVRRRYAFYALPAARDVRGVEVLPAAARKDVAAALWGDATGTRKPVETAHRTPGQKSLAQYISRMHRIATDPVWGLAALETDETARAAEDVLKKERAETKEEEERRAAAAAAAAFRAWRETLPPAERDAFRIVSALMVDDSVGASHAAAFCATILPAE